LALSFLAHRDLMFTTGDCPPDCPTF
jgi:hypothetical protein